MPELTNSSTNHDNTPDIVMFQTLGCKVNRYETDAVRQSFEASGFCAQNEGEGHTCPDVYVLNTCTVTAEADRKSRQMIRRAKKKYPGAIVVAMGCHVEMLDGQSEADISIGTKNRLSAVRLAHELLEKRKFSQDPDATGFAYGEVYASGDKYQEFGPVLSQEDTRAYIKIEDGCDSFCSYCVIPYARGRVSSRETREVLREAEELAGRGFREIVLTGIHICSFGKDRGEDISALGDLLLGLEQIQGIERIRLGSLEPNSLTEDFVRRIAGMSKICPHFHISLQSGSDGVLRKMNRKYDTKQYRECIGWLRRYFKDLSVGTDVIVGFPTETGEEHEESLAFCREIGFSGIHVFPFSERKGTKAAEMTPKVPQDIKLKRRDEFLVLAGGLAGAYGRTFVGQTVSVLLETVDEDGFFTGYTRDYVRVHIEPDVSLEKGNTVSVVVDSCAEGVLYGRTVSKIRD